MVRTARSATRPHREVGRAQIIVLAHRGWKDHAIAAKLGIDPRTARNWIDRFLHERDRGLIDHPRPGRARVYSVEDRALAMALACELPSREGAALSRFSFTELAREVAHEIRPAPSRSTLHRWLREAHLQPWRSQYWKRPRDPEFGPKAARVLDLYHRVWEGQPLHPRDVVLCLDEKTCIQALRRQRPTQPPAPGQPARVEHEYSQNGTVIYLAALNMGNGQVIGEFPEANKKIPFFAFVERLMAREPCRSAPRVFFILDNGPAHDPRTFPARVAERWPKVHLAFTPKHGSWLNAVEQYFSAVERKALTPNDLPTVEAVKERIRGFEQRRNRHARPPRWNWTKEEMREWLAELEQEQGLNLGSSLIPA
ncbi:MAG: IS630 family transposase [Thermoplasmata archaeon]